MKYPAIVQKNLRSVALWSAVGYMFLFFAEWFACGIGGPPGNLLSTDIAKHNLFGAVGAASLAMFFGTWLGMHINQSIQAAQGSTVCFNSIAAKHLTCLWVKSYR